MSRLFRDSVSVCLALLVISWITAPQAAARPPKTQEGQEPPPVVPPHLAKTQAAGQPGALVGPPAQPNQVKPAAPHGGGVPAAPTPTVQLKPGEEPKIEFDTPTYDFGRIKTGNDVAHDYWFHNTGNGPLEILQVKPSCGCTTSGQYDKIVMPGQSGKIPIKVSTAHATGPIAKSITIVTNIPGAGSTSTLQIKGELWQVIQATPSSALFGNVSAAQTKEGPVVRKLTVLNNGDEIPKFGEINNTNKAFTSELKELEPKKKWELTVTLAKDLSTGVQSGMIEIPTGVPELAKLQIACSAYLVADVDVVPNKMPIPATRTAPLQRDFYVRNNGAKPLRVYDLAGSNAQLKVGLQETQTGTAWRITMELPPEYKVPKDGDKITFKTDHPNYPTITIPVTEAPPPAAAMPQVTAYKPPTTTRPAAVGARPAGSPPVAQGTLNPAAKGPPPAAGGSGSTVQAAKPAGAAPTAPPMNKPAGH